MYDKDFVLGFAFFYRNALRLKNRRCKSIDEIFSDYCGYYDKRKKPEVPVIVEDSVIVEAVVDYACFMYCILKEMLETGARYGDIPAVRYTICRVLKELGYTETEIGLLAGKYIGDRSSVYYQINRTKLWHLPGYEIQAAKLNEIFNEFRISVEKCDQ